MDKKLLDKWLNGELSANDLQELDNDSTFASYRKIDHFVKQIELPKMNLEASLEEVKQKRKEAKAAETKVRRLPVLLKIAAVLAVLVATYVFYNTLPTSHTTTMAASTTVQLPDASEVVLNENSKISYNEKSWEDSRKINLEGEAYFKVAKGKTFTVETSQGTVTVLGTQFNVIDRENEFTVSCYEGRVAVVYNGNQVALTAGNSIALENEKLVNSSLFVNKPEWLGNESSYDDVLIGNVLKDLEHHYDINVATKNIDVTLRFTGSYTHNDLKAALQTITLPLGLTYAIESENSVSISPAD